MPNNDNYYVVSGQILSAFADLIRQKGGTSAPLEWPLDFGEAVYNLPTGSTTIEALNVTQNGTYTAPSGTAYSPVTVAVTAADTLEQRATNTLTTYTNSNITTLAASSFRSCTALQSVSLPNCTAIGEYSFQYCPGLTTLSAPSVTFIGSDGLNGCTNLETLSIGTLTEIKSNAFRDCKKLAVPIVFTGTTINDYAFYNCEKLTSITANSTTKVYGNAFQNCKALASISLPAVTTMSSSTFNGCTALTSVDLNSSFAGNGETNMFSNCPNLEVLDWKNGKTIGTQMFNYDTKLATLILRKSDAIATLSNINAFNNTPFASGKSGGTLYVPNDLISAYQSANNWSTILGYANNSIQKIEGSIYE